MHKVKLKKINKINSVKLWLIIIFSLFFNFEPVIAKIQVFTYSYNRPDFIEFQYKLLKKFLTDPHEFIVFNDAVDKEIEDQINKECRKNGIKCIKIPQEIHAKPYLQRVAPYDDFNHPTVRNSNVVQWSLNNFGFKSDDTVMLLDSDMFLVKKLNIKKLMKKYDLAAWFKPCTENHIEICKKVHPHIPRIEYCWIGLVILNFKTLPNKKDLNFNCGSIKNLRVSAGGYTYYYLQNNPKIKLFPINRTSIEDLICKNCKIKKTEYCKHNNQKLKNLKFSNQMINFIQDLPLKDIEATTEISKRRHRNPELFFNNAFIHYRCGTNYHNKSSSYIAKKSKAFFDFLQKALES